MNITVKPCKLTGAVQAPPSKSYAHRLLICAALADGSSTVHGISKSEDMYATLDCIAALGISAHKEGDTVSISSSEHAPLENAVFPCRESGSTLRFFIPIALAFGGSAVFTGTERLMERGVSVYETIFPEKGITIEKASDSIRVSGKLLAGEYTLRGDISSQFVSGLLFALPMLEGDSVIRVLPPVESRKYIDITIDAMKSFGVEVTETEPNTFNVKGSQSYRCRELSVEGDWSNAAALYGFNALGSQLEISGLNSNSIQGDRVCVDILEKLNGQDAVIDLSDCPDLGPVMFAAAAAKNGATFTGTRRLRIKESDRAQAMADELLKFGIMANVLENAVIIEKGTLKPPTQKLSGHNDHRIVMAMTLLSSIVGGEIEGMEAIRKSYPDFFEVLGKAGLETLNGI